MTESERFAASFRSLNDEQRTAATATEGYVRVIAGAPQQGVRLYCVQNGGGSGGMVTFYLFWKM